MSSINTFHIDCMKFMAKSPDLNYDLAICDIPYGINVGKMAYLRETQTTVKQKNGKRLSANKNKKPYTQYDWDIKPPTQEYFDELRRISKHQIIFGIEYVDWKNAGSGRIKWNKGVPENLSFKSYEIAYCSLIDTEIELPLLWSGMNQAKSLDEPMTQRGNKKKNEKRIHPCHKPILLYRKLLIDYAKPNYKIFDSHLGGGSIMIACDEVGYSLDACEINIEYLTKTRDRYANYKSNLKLPFP